MNVFIHSKINNTNKKFLYILLGDRIFDSYKGIRLHSLVENAFE
jgi:hypothetical protein